MYVHTYINYILWTQCILQFCYIIDGLPVRGDGPIVQHQVYTDDLSHISWSARKKKNKIITISKMVGEPCIYKSFSWSTGEQYARRNTHYSSAQTRDAVQTYTTHAYNMKSLTLVLLVGKSVDFYNNIILVKLSSAQSSGPYFTRKTLSKHMHHRTFAQII